MLTREIIMCDFALLMMASDGDTQFMRNIYTYIHKYLYFALQRCHVSGWNPIGPNSVTIN